MNTIEAAKLVANKLESNAINNPTDFPEDTANFLAALAILQSTANAKHIGIAISNAI